MPRESRVVVEVYYNIAVLSFVIAVLISYGLGYSARKAHKKQAFNLQS